MSELNKKEIGARIESVRRREGLTMEEFGEIVGGTAQSLVSRWENGLCVPNVRRQMRIAEIGNITVDELLYGTGVETMPTLNGKTYEMQHLTDEEKAVINAMRRGAKICVDFHGLRELDEADALMELFSGIEITSKYIYDLTGVGSIAFSHWGDHVQANYYIKK